MTCTGLEPTDRGLDDRMDLRNILRDKFVGITAIPTGIYKVELLPSVRFRRIMPFIQNIKGFANIEIHTGNSSYDTQGCILVGMTDESGKDRISYSHTALRLLLAYVNAEPVQNFEIEIRRNELAWKNWNNRVMI